jgi:hypothetical protein
VPGGVVRIGNYWFRLAMKNGKPDYAAKPAPFFPPQVAPAEITEATTSPEVRVPHSFRDLSGGGGQGEVPQAGENTRYARVGDAEGEGVDASLTPNGPVILAPLLTIRTTLSVPSGATAGSHTPDGTLNGSLVSVDLANDTTNLYFGMGTKMFRYNGSSFTDAVSISPSVVSGAPVKFRGVQTGDYLYAPTGYTTAVYYSADDGPTWTAVAAPSDLTNAQSMVVLDGEVIVARASPTGNGQACVSSFDDGGAAPTLFGVIDPVGDPSIAISQLVVFQGRVVVLKSGEGVFLLANDRRSLSQELFPELRGVTIYAEGATVWRGVLWLPTNRGLYAISAGFSIQHVGPEANETFAGPTSGQAVGGRVLALGGDAFNLYAVRGGPATSFGVLYKANVRVSGGGVEEIAWHPLNVLASGAVYSLSGEMGCKHMAMLPSNARMFLDRELPKFPAASTIYSVYQVPLPRYSADPRGQSMDYADAGTLYYSRAYARFPSVNKGWHGIVPTTAPLTLRDDGQTAVGGTISVTPRYKLPSVPLTGTTPFGYTVGTTQSTGEGVREVFFLRGKALDTAARLVRTQNNAGETPQLRGFTLEYDLEPDVLWQHAMTLDLTEGSYAEDGGSGGADPLSPEAALRYLRTLPASGTLTFVDPWRIAYTVTMPMTGVGYGAERATQEGLSGDTPLSLAVVLNEQQPVVAP